MLIGNSIFWYDSLESTQDKVIETLKQDNIRSGDIIISWEQYQGRGQRNRKWITEPGQNLTLSFPIYIQKAQISQPFTIITFISLALHRFLQQLLPNHKIYIKWINDIIIQNRKICGILIDTLVQKNQLKYAIIGIGLNVNQSEFPLLPYATSLKLITQKAYELVSILDKLVVCLNHYAEMFFQAKHTLLHSLYNQYLYRRGDWIAGEKILGVDEKGLLFTSDYQSQVHHYSFHEHKFDFYQ